MSFRRIGLGEFLPDSTRSLKFILVMRTQKLSEGAWTIKGEAPIGHTMTQVWQECSLLPLISTHRLSKDLQTSLNRSFWFSVFFLLIVKLSIITSS